MQEVDIHKIIDDAMTKGDRSVIICINKDSVTVSVYPYVEEKHYWIKHNDKDYPECSNCGHRDRTWDCSIYCPDCGEQMHGVKEEAISS